MTLPRRIQLVKLLRANGLRDVERMREDELRAALSKLRLVVPDPVGAAPSSGAFLARPSEPPPIVDDSDDPHALPRFREPKLSLPDHQRTFLKAIAVKPRLLFCTWDLSQSVRESIDGRVELQLAWREFLGDAPHADEMAGQGPAARIDVDPGAPGWYVNVPGERIALVASLVVAHSGRVLVSSNVSLTPPARPGPPGPLWMANLPPSLDRRRLLERKLMKGEEGDLHRVGETDARSLDLDMDLEEEWDPAMPGSATRVRLPWQTAPSSSTHMRPLVQPLPLPPEKKR